MRKRLEEEKETDQKLTELAEEINVQAKAGSGEEGDEESGEETPRAKARSARASS